MKNLSLIRVAARHSKPQPCAIGKKLFKRFPYKNFFLSVFCALFLQVSVLAQNIVFNSTPVTTATALNTYSYNVNIVTPDNKPITFSTQGFPSWLTLGSSTGAPTTLTSSIGIVNGLVADQHGNIYAAQSSTTGKIYKIDKDGNTAVFADKISTGSTQSMIIVGDYLYASHSVAATGIVRYDLTQSNPTPVAVYNGYATSDLTYHDGAIYATTATNQKIIRLDLTTNVATEFLTTPFTCLATEFDQNGDLLIFDTGGNVQKYSFATSSYAIVISGLAFGGYELQWDPQGNLYTSSAVGIRKYSSTFTLLGTAAASVSSDLTFTPDGALVYAPASGGNVYALKAKVALSGTPSHADVGSYPVKIIASNGTVTEEQDFTITVTDPRTIWFHSTPVTSVNELESYSYPILASSDNGGVSFSAPGLPAWLSIGPSTPGPKQLNNTSVGTTGGIAMDADGNFYVAHYSPVLDNIYKVDKDGNTTVFATKTMTLATSSLLIVGDYLYVAYFSPATGKIARYDLTQTNPVETNAFSVTGINDLAYHNGVIYGIQGATKKIIRMDVATNQVSDFLVLSNTPRAITINNNGDMLFSDNTGALYKYSFSTSSYTQVASGLPTSPTSLLMDAAGHLFVSGNNAKIRRYDPMFTSYAELPFTSTRSYDMCLSTTGTLVYGDYFTGFIYDLGSHATLTGNPTHADVGSYPITITTTDGTITTQHQFTITVTDPNAPLLTSSNPVNAAIDIPGSQPVVLTFNEQVKAGTGNIEIRRVDNNELLESIDVTNTAKIVFNNETVTLSHNDIPNSTNVYIYISAGVIVDNSNNPFVGFTTSSTLAYTTFGCTATLIAADGITNIAPNSSVTLSASAGTAYSWIKDNAIIPASSGSTYSASAAGDYSVVVTTTQGCRDTSNVVHLEQYSGEPALMPKLFSPNGDGINDIIIPITPGLKTFTALKIYNRWGNLVFESRDREKGWDGKLNGKPQPTDSYVWICTGTDYSDRAYTKKGILTLIR